MAGSSPEAGPGTPGDLGVAVLVGGVGELYQGDLDLGRRVVERLDAEGAPHGVLAEELTYGAIAVTQRLEELRPEALVLVAAHRRGRRPGTLERRRLVPPAPDPTRLQTAVQQAGTGYVDLDLLVEVAAGLGALPARTVAVEVEPELAEPSTELSAAGRAGLDAATACVRREAERAPVLALADRARGRLEALSPSPAADALRELLDALDGVDHEGRWGRTFAARDRLRRAVAEGAAGAEVSRLDWALWWGLLEGLDRVQRREVATVAPDGDAAGDPAGPADGGAGA